MFKRLSVIVLLLLAASLVLSPLSALAADRTTKYRLYEADRVVREYRSLNEAIADGRKRLNSHVERIDNREWVWDNLARYRVYQNDKTLPGWQTATLDEAVAIAKKYANSSVRDLRKGGWVWHSFPRLEKPFLLMQGDKTLPGWQFADLESAQKEAKKWANAHIIDLRTNEWIWDNLSPERKEQLRAGEAVYQIVDAGYAIPDLLFGYLEDAIGEALSYDNAAVVNVKTGKTVYTNAKPYEVYQNAKLLERFASLDDAVAYAKKWAHATIRRQDRIIWSNFPYYRVFQNDRQIGEFNDPREAVAYAKKYANSSVVTLHDEVLWDNKRKLQFWSWNGSAKPETIRQHVSNTMGLDVVSPTWFVLERADGTLKDTSDMDTVRWLKQNGYAVHPLIHNQFDAKLTTAFLKDENAQKAFINKLVNKAAELGVDGLNLDFESLAGSDRARYTAFVRRFTEAAHAKGLVVSIDLPRGSVRWNHLTAFDHEALADIVDYIIIMAYDQYYSGSDSPGSVSGLQWTEEGIKEFLSYGIPRSKLILGIPFYARDWKLDANGNLKGNRSLLMKDIPNLLATKNVTKTWDERFNQYKVTYREDGHTRVFWLEDEQTIAERLKLAKKYDLAGVAAWRMGHEYPEIWETMLQNK